MSVGCTMTPSPFLLPHLLENAAKTHPNVTAVRCGDDELSYAELRTRAARFGAALGTRGVGPGDPVGIHMAKSLDAVVAIHGTQRAGAISVPIDIMTPPAVLKGIAAEIGLAAIVTDTQGNSRFGRHKVAPLDVGPHLDVPQVVGPGGDSDRHMTWDEVATHEIAPIAPSAGDDPAYMITTSGSTGAPKAIVHTHRSGLSYAQQAASCYGLGPNDRLASVAPFHFDQSTFELFAAVAACATVVLVREPLLKFPAELSSLVEREKISVWYSVPTILIHLLNRGALDRRDLSSLRWVLFGGEMFPSAALRELMGHLPNVRFSNVYGPAEVNHCAHHHLEEPPGLDDSIPIGSPWNETSLRLVDDDANLVEGKGRGLLEVRTSTMMAGYWRQPGLTAASISVETSSDGLTERWYRTGDVVERTADGLLHFRGRADRQTKIRGNRVELEAVEAAVSDAPHVLRCAAVTVESNEGAQLVAVVEGQDELDPEEVLASVRAALPPYAVPTNIVIVDSLPRTTSGKVDTRAAAIMATTAPDVGERP